MTTLLVQYVADWLLTWFLHATVVCALALVAGQWLIRDPKARDLFWKGSLLVPLATSSAGLCFGRTSMALANWAHSHAPPLLASLSISIRSSPGTIDQIQVHDPMSQWLPVLVIGFLLLPASVACLRLAREHQQLRNGLRSRMSVDHVDLGVDARALSLRGGVAQLTISRQVASAAAIGSSEICLSASFLRLGAREKQGVIAHEVAHLERSDVAWQKCADFVSAALVTQPLVRLVARWLRRDAEFICDEIAVRRTGDRVAYLRALTAFAERQEIGQFAAVAYGDSQIIQRAQRVLAINLAVRRGTRERVVMVGIAILILSTLFAVPHIKTGSPASRVITRVVPQVSSAAMRVSVTINGRASR